jgi:hypothetical protein
VYVCVCRLQHAENFWHRQKAWKLETELGHKTEAEQKLGRRRKDLHAGSAQHTLCSTQSLGVSLPVPALRTKHFVSESLKETSSSCAASSVIQVVADDVNEDSNARISGTESKNTVNTVKHNRAERTRRDSSVDYPLHNTTADKCSLQINNPDCPLRRSDAEYLLNNYSVEKETSEPVTISYHRPATEIMKAGDYNSSVQKCHEDSRTNALELMGPRTRHCELPMESVQCVSSLQPEDTSNCEKKLDDSLLIPILRAPSPVIPTATIGQAASGSDTVHKLEAKWQVWYYLCIPSPVSLFTLCFKPFGIIFYLELDVLISSRGQPTRGGPPAWGLGEVLTTPHRKNLIMLRIIHRGLSMVVACSN